MHSHLDREQQAAAEISVRQFNLKICNVNLDDRNQDSISQMVSLYGTLSHWYSFPSQITMNGFDIDTRLQLM